MDKLQTNANLETAIDCLRDQMADGLDTAGCVVGDTLTALLQLRPELAGKIGEKGKTIKGGMEAMKAEARKQAKNGSACLDFFSGMKIVLKYYGIEDISEGEIARAHMNMFIPQAEAQTPAPLPEAPAADELDIDALLGVL